MARFNPEDYELVETRIRKFYELHPDGRIVTENLTTLQDRQVSTWVVKTSLYVSREDQEADCPKSTGLAFEVDGGKGPNETSALENCETSSIGRALANMNLSGNKRASREEMEKVARGVTPAALPPLSVEERQVIVHQIAEAETKQQLRDLWAANGQRLNDVWTNALGEEVSFKQLILARQSEVKE